MATLPFELAMPQALALLPLALLPLVPLVPAFGRRGDELGVGSTRWLPRDPLGTVAECLWRVLAVATIACLVVALARPATEGTRIERVGRGAEILVLLDRSSSMDAQIRLPPPALGEAPRAAITKNGVVRESLTRLVAERPDNRYALTMFNAAPMPSVPFGDDPALVRAGLDASGIGRGPSDTEMGRALIAAVETFDGRAYTGSRAIMLVSDGGARLDEETRERIRRGLARNRVALYFVYIRSSPNSPNLERVSTVAAELASDVASLEEIALHVFFGSLESEYRVFEADDPESMSTAVTAIDERQNLPLTWFERVPRVDLTRPWLALACAGSLVLLGLSVLRRGATSAVRVTPLPRSGPALPSGTTLASPSAGRPAVATAADGAGA